ncbi:endonuclease/exonuclease/phosphatase family protein [Agromyces marinus]|uniref:Metal-dependent hydrolase n=1 Tax=Agromyces marinus TaxID=1389020 RepID=A0ABM8GZL0_9MICO|nr:endonuclease/exonuclease/phosphatase family protein [Agromyces marinus]UIP57876.1 hypothetical protein DSM26151_07420 [Agromyces marinus]BDZ53930.1 metal-dependent hydrolase [Agromyces marinus]
MTTEAPLIGPARAPDLHVMSFNIRRRMPFSRAGGPDRWAERAPLVRALLDAERPTVLAVQEALAGQAGAVSEGLGPTYRRLGVGREPGGRGEGAPIFYDAERLELTGWRQRALSATPDVHGSRTASWGNLTRRSVITAGFVDRETGFRIHVFNTHLDHISPRARINSATYLARLAADLRLEEPDAAIVVTGDFNADERSAVHGRLTGDGPFLDAWDLADEHLTPAWRTYSGYRRRRLGRRIDHILVAGPVRVARAGVNAVRFAGRAASDHDPVQALLRPATAPPTEGAAR